MNVSLTVPPEWMLEGECAKSDRPDDWFPERGDTWVAREAKRVCREECPVATQCLAYAIENREVGIWGATDEVDRIKLTNHIDGTCQGCGKNIGPRSIRCRACENQHRNESAA